MKDTSIKYKFPARCLRPWVRQRRTVNRLRSLAERLANVEDLGDLLHFHATLVHNSIGCPSNADAEPRHRHRRASSPKLTKDLLCAVLRWHADSRCVQGLRIGGEVGKSMRLGICHGDDVHDDAVGTSFPHHWTTSKQPCQHDNCAVVLHVNTTDRCTTSPTIQNKQESQETNCNFNSRVSKNSEYFRKVLNSKKPKSTHFSTMDSHHRGNKIVRGMLTKHSKMTITFQPKFNMHLNQNAATKTTAASMQKNFHHNTSKLKSNITHKTKTPYFVKNNTKPDRKNTNTKSSYIRRAKATKKQLSLNQTSGKSKGDKQIIKPPAKIQTVSQKPIELSTSLSTSRNLKSAEKQASKSIPEIPDGTENQTVQSQLQTTNDILTKSLNEDEDVLTPNCVTSPQQNFNVTLEVKSDDPTMKKEINTIHENTFDAFASKIHLMPQCNLEKYPNLAMGLPLVDALNSLPSAISISPKSCKSEPLKLHFSKPDLHVISNMFKLRKPLSEGDYSHRTFQKTSCINNYSRMDYSYPRNKFYENNDNLSKSDLKNQIRPFHQVISQENSPIIVKINQQPVQQDTGNQQYSSGSSILLVKDQESGIYKNVIDLPILPRLPEVIDWGDKCAPEYEKQKNEDPSPEDRLFVTLPAEIDTWLVDRRQELDQTLLEETGEIPPNSSISETSTGHIWEIETLTPVKENEEAPNRQIKKQPATKIKKQTNVVHKKQPVTATKTRRQDHTPIRRLNKNVTAPKKERAPGRRGISKQPQLTKNTARPPDSPKKTIVKSSTPTNKVCAGSIQLHSKPNSLYRNKKNVPRSGHTLGTPEASENNQRKSKSVVPNVSNIRTMESRSSRNFHSTVDLPEKSKCLPTTFKNLTEKTSLASRSSAENSKSSAELRKKIQHTKATEDISQTRLRKNNLHLPGRSDINYSQVITTSSLGSSSSSIDASACNPNTIHHNSLSSSYERIPTPKSSMKSLNHEDVGDTYQGSPHIYYRTTRSAMNKSAVKKSPQLYNRIFSSNMKNSVFQNLPSLHRNTSTVSANKILFQKIPQFHYNSSTCAVNNMPAQEIPQLYYHTSTNAVNNNTPVQSKGRMTHTHSPKCQAFFRKVRDTFISHVLNCSKSKCRRKTKHDFSSSSDNMGTIL